MPEATNHADTYYRHGEADPSKWVEAEAVTDRKADAVQPNTTFADRAKAQGANKAIQPGDAEGKSLEDMTKPELMALAADRDIEGRSSMTKPELIVALSS